MSAEKPIPSRPSLVRLLTVLMPAMLLVPIASDMVALVLPAITQEFGNSTGQASWVVTGFFLACAIGIPMFGRLADRLPLRQLFIAAILTYVAGSLICALAPSLLVLVAGRVLSDFGGAAIPVLTIVAASRLLHRKQVSIGVGAIASAGGLGAALGPRSVAAWASCWAGGCCSGSCSLPPSPSFRRSALSLRTLSRDHGVG